MNAITGTKLSDAKSFPRKIQKKISGQELNSDNSLPHEGDLSFQY
ncbi:hypothetical protein LEP1GSC195_1248 [Leptospira wolbachii serovar Codice str. CDC]|uniref:Uncharacterized protein n=1 Tax=Leptospira wolbachii serovar Codice str. CDC TaxID=1218599 RepID=R9A753_9LEPT|nr:hypothetical protein LEP1GSC195_1248 [Leptospira wolbachii serovar Codice str. CDC]